MVQIKLFNVPLQIKTRGNKAFLSNITPSSIPTEKQQEVRDRFKKAVSRCKGQRQPEFSRCVGDELTVHQIISEEEVFDE